MSIVNTTSQSEKLYKESFYNIPMGTDKAGNILVVNSNKPTMAWLSPEAYESIKGKENLKASNVRAKLIEMGFVVEQEHDELKRIFTQRNFMLTSDNSPVIQYVIAPTMACNMHCVYCFENCTEEKRTMSANMLNKVLDTIKAQIDNCPNCQKIRLCWFGGEPTLMTGQIIHFMDSLNCFLGKKGLEIEASIISNGLLLNRETAEKFKVLGIKTVQITLDGTAKNYARLKRCNELDFYTIVENIKNICDILNVTIRVNVNRYNLDDVKLLYIYLLKEQGLNGKIKIYVANIMTYENGMPEENVLSPLEFEQFRREFYQWICSLGYINSIPHSFPVKKVVNCGLLAKSSRIFGPDGLLYRCEQYLGKSEMYIGSLEKGYMETETDKRFRCLSIPRKCARCKYFPFCASGCQAKTGFEHIPTDCEAVRYAIETDVRLYIKASKQK